VDADAASGGSGVVDEGVVVGAGDEDNAKEIGAGSGVVGKNVVV